MCEGFGFAEAGTDVFGGCDLGHAEVNRNTITRQARSLPPRRSLRWNRQPPALL